MEQKIASISYYPALFQQAFGTDKVTRERISMALAQFLRAMNSSNSPADRNELTLQEMSGQALFFNLGCSHCHNGENLGGAPIPGTGGGYFGNPEAANAANIGLDVVYEDKGIKEITGSETLDGAFIIPSLRNLSFTAPYMHDGRYATLEEVVEHYNSGIQPSVALDHNLVNTVTATPVQMNMTAAEKAALVAFLKTLSDPSITTDVRFSNPFN